MQIIFYCNFIALNENYEYSQRVPKEYAHYADKQSGHFPQENGMDTQAVASADGMVSLTNGAIKDTTAQQVITKTLEKVQAAPQIDTAAVQQSAANAAGLGTRLDIKV